MYNPFDYCCGIVEIAAANAATSPAIAKRDRYSAVIATTIPSQRKKIAALKKAGFEATKTFTNSKTRRKVTLWFKNLKGVKAAKPEPGPVYDPYAPYRY